MGPRLSGDKILLPSPLIFTIQDPKIREVLGFGGPDTRLEEKLMTVVAGPDPVNTTFLNFMAVQDDIVKVGWGQETTQESRCFIGRYVAQAGLKLRATILLSFSSAGITGISHHAQFCSRDVLCTRPCSGCRLWLG